jgi:DNA-binding NarL/FixJ family response regulator
MTFQITLCGRKSKTNLIKTRIDLAGRLSGLTKRQIEVCQELATGAGRKGAAGQIGVSVKTVEYHVYKVWKKLNVSSDESAIAWLLS